MSDLPLFDAAASRAARDKGVQDVADAAHLFMHAAMQSIPELRKRIVGVFAAEDIRRELTSMGITPHSPNTWGALTRTLASRNEIVPTGAWAPMRDTRSHARMTPQYRWRD